MSDEPYEVGSPEWKAYWAGQNQAFGQIRKSLAEKAQALVDLLEDAEVNHGGLVGTKTLTAKNVLRMELSRWK
jgi:hypothetical protein